MENTWPQLSERLEAFFKVRAGDSQELRIVYYNGHGGPGPDQQLVLASHNLETNRSSTPHRPKPPAEAAVQWFKIADRMYEAKCDTLAILDCCDAERAFFDYKKYKSGSFGDYQREFIGACRRGETTRYHMSPAMWNVLNSSLVEKGDSISASELVKRMNHSYRLSYISRSAPDAVHHVLQHSRVRKINLPRLDTDIPQDQKKVYQEYKDLYKEQKRLSGRNALVLGGDSGIGRSTAIAFALEGANVTIAYRAELEQDAQSTKAEARRLGATPIELFPLEKNYEKDALDEYLSELSDTGVVDIVVNNLGYKVETDEDELISMPGATSGLRSIRGGYRTQTGSFGDQKFISTALNRMNSQSIIINTIPLENSTGLISDAEYRASISLTKDLTKNISASKQSTAVAIFPGPDWLLLSNTEQAIRVLDTFVSAASATDDEKKAMTGEVLELFG
ncbi:hypothetical protein TWF506_005825 [Arthrobotrys conoides]|uniref:Uncharacterized protein n=1 Tax=Arthrobotrys conoides TaxID=74498 RepID=A0AAN8P7G0_9PEZI